MLYPEPLGSDSGFKNISILFLACSGNTKLYNNGIDTIATIAVIIIYFLSIPAANNIITIATKNAAAVPQSGCFIINNTGTANIARITNSLVGLFISALSLCCILFIAYTIARITNTLANSPG